MDFTLVSLKISIYGDTNPDLISLPICSSKYVLTFLRSRKYKITTVVYLLNRLCTLFNIVCTYNLRVHGQFFRLGRKFVLYLFFLTTSFRGIITLQSFSPINTI